MPGLGHRYGPNPNTFGAEGLGGQFGFADPDAKIAVGYVRSELAAFDVLQSTLTGELYRCAGAVGHDVAVEKTSPLKRVAGTVIGAYAPAASWQFPLHRPEPVRHATARSEAKRLGDQHRPRIGANRPGPAAPVPGSAVAESASYPS